MDVAQRERCEMKIKKLFLVILAFVLLSVVTGIPSERSLSRTVKAVPTNLEEPTEVPAITVFSGTIICFGLKTASIDVYINHVKQDIIIPIILGVDGICRYLAPIPMLGIQVGSTAIFKVGDNTYGAGILDSKTKILNLLLDEQSH